MKTLAAIIVLLLACSASLGQTLHVITPDPNLPSEVFSGNVKVRPARIRPGTNPSVLVTIDDSDFFVQQQYIDFLNRMPDSPGFAFWNGQITNCKADAGCVDVMRVNTSAAFYLSIEFQQTGYLVERIYKASYGDAIGTSTFGGLHQLAVPIVRLDEFLPDTKQIGQNVIVNKPGWQDLLETNKQNFVAAFVTRARFTTAYPANMAASAFVDTLNQNAGSPLSPAKRDQLVNNLAAQTMSRADVLRAVAEDNSFSTAEFSRAFVLMQYFGYLRRDPNSGNDADHSGYDFWLRKLDQFKGNFNDAEMVKAFILSAEYRNRF